MTLGDIKRIVDYGQTNSFGPSCEYTYQIVQDPQFLYIAY